MNLSELPVLQKVLDRKATNTNGNTIRLSNVTVDMVLPEGFDPNSDNVELWLKDASGRLIRITGTPSALTETDQDNFGYQWRDRVW
jgi:hypothetical protein